MVRLSGTVLIVIAVITATAAEPTPIRVGMSAALSGPAQSLGTEMRLGIETFFHKINSQGGLNGRHLELIAMDDGYVPQAAVRT